MSETSELPESFVEARRKDEAFWQQQERRVQGSLGQPCCTLSGISSGLINMPGNFAVIVHGEDECAACFRHVGPSAANFYSTGLTEKEFVTGETHGPLETCLRLVAAETEPEAIFILGACPVEVIGDRFETAVARIQPDFPDIPMMSMHTSGLKVGSQAAMLDWMFSTLASLDMVEPAETTWRRELMTLSVDLRNAARSRDSKILDWAHERATHLQARRELKPETSLNLMGMPAAGRAGNQREGAADLLRNAGLDVVASFPHDANFRDWRAIKFSKATFVADRSLYPKLTKVLEDSGQQVVDVPLPTGVTQSAEVFRTIGRVYGIEDAMEVAIAEPMGKAKALVDAFAERHRGMRVAMGLRMLNNYEADQLAWQGLGDFHAMSELGFDLTVMVQGPPDKRAKFEKLFKARGIEIPFEMFPEPWTLSEHIGGDRFDIAYMPDHCRAECRKAGVALIVSRAFEPWFSGVETNLRHLERTIGRR